MIKNNTAKFPRFFVYILLILAAIMFIGMFFSVNFVGITYFIALLVCIVLLLLDKRYGTILTNYKLTFFLFDLINMIAVIAIIYYEFFKHTFILNLFLIELIIVEAFLFAVDILVVKNKNISKEGCFFVNVVKLGSMICILTYFYKVSTLWFAIDALIFEIASIVLKIYFNSVKFGKINKIETEKESEIVKIETRIHSADENEEGIDEWVQKLL